MKFKECVYCSHETLTGNPSNGTCNLFFEYNAGSYRFIDCEQIPISKCPYKMYYNGLIDKIELNKQIEKLRR